MLAFAEPCSSPCDRGEGEGEGHNHFYAYGVVARLALLAAAREGALQMPKPAALPAVTA
jgi:glutamate--cysteine ligase